MDVAFGYEPIAPTRMNFAKEALNVGFPREVVLTIPRDDDVGADVLSHALNDVTTKKPSPQGLWSMGMGALRSTRLRSLGYSRFEASVPARSQ